MACFIGVLRMDVNTGIIMNPPPMPINPHKNPVNILIGINWNKGCSVVSEVSLGVLFSSSNKDVVHNVKENISSIKLSLVRV